MTEDELKALIEDLRLNHEFCPKEVILQAADELERLAQRTWVGLTDEHIIKIRKVLRGRGQQFDSVNDLARAIEAKLKEKNCVG
jgi:hypothetical protein